MANRRPADLAANVRLHWEGRIALLFGEEYGRVVPIPGDIHRRWVATCGSFETMAQCASFEDGQRHIEAIFALGGLYK